MALEQGRGALRDVGNIDGDAIDVVQLEVLGRGRQRIAVHVHGNGARRTQPPRGNRQHARTRSDVEHRATRTRVTLQQLQAETR